MVNRDRADSKKHLWRAFGLLCVGSVLLLCTKLQLTPVWDTLLCFGGGGILLYANGEFLFGLLIHANMDEAPPPPSTSSVSSASSSSLSSSASQQAQQLALLACKKD